MKSLVKLSLLASLLIGASASAGEFGIGANVSKIDMEGNFNYLGTDINTKDTLGMNKKDTVVVPTISYTSGKHMVFANYTSTSFDGDTTLTSNVVFNGTTYAAATDVHSEIDTKWGVLGYRYNVGDLGTSNLVNLKLGADLHIINLSAEIESAVQSDKYDVTFGMPTFALGLDVKPIKSVTLFGEVNAMTFGSYGNYVEYDLGAKVACPIIKGVEWKAGYKSKEFDLEADSDEKFNLEFKGAYAGLTYNF